MRVFTGLLSLMRANSLHLCGIEVWGWDVLLLCSLKESR